jgi:hypothetical protein
MDTGQLGFFKSGQVSTVTVTPAALEELEHFGMAAIDMAKE